jgi:hypothetical protein
MYYVCNRWFVERLSHPKLKSHHAGEITNTDFFGNNKFTIKVRTKSYTSPSATGYEAEIDVIHTATGQVLKHLAGIGAHVW